MNVWILLLLCLISFNIFAKGSRKIDVSPEQISGIWSFQIEENFYHIQHATSSNGDQLPTNTNYINGSTEYLTKFGLDISIGSYNIPISGGGAQNYEYDSYINISQTFDIIKDWKLTIGTQNGTTLFTPRQLHNADYSVISYKPLQNTELYAGPYFVNAALSGTVNKIGCTTGLVYEFTKDWKIVSDYFSGTNNLSGAQFHVFWKYYYFGVLVPETNSGNEFAGEVGVKFHF